MGALPPPSAPAHLCSYLTLAIKSFLRFSCKKPCVEDEKFRSFFLKYSSTGEFPPKINSSRMKNSIVSSSSFFSSSSLSYCICEESFCPNSKVGCQRYFASTMIQLSLGDEGRKATPPPPFAHFHRGLPFSAGERIEREVGEGEKGEPSPKGEWRDGRLL